MEIKDFDRKQCIPLGTHRAGGNLLEILYKSKTERDFFIETLEAIGNTHIARNIRKLPANWACEWALGNLNEHELDYAIQYFDREDAIQ